MMIGDGAFAHLMTGCQASDDLSAQSTVEHPDFPKFELTFSLLVNPVPQSGAFTSLFEAVGSRALEETSQDPQPDPFDE